MDPEKAKKKLNELQFELEYWQGKKEEAVGDTQYANANVNLVKKQIEEINEKLTN